MTSSLLRELGLDLLSLVWPTECLGCGRADRDLCEPCRAALRLQLHPTPVTPKFGATGPWCVATEYEGAVRQMIVHLKHQGRVGFARELGRALAVPLGSILAHYPLAVPVLLPMPSRRSRVRERGYRHLELVSRHARDALGYRKNLRGSHFEISRALRPTRGRAGQVGLGTAARLANAGHIELRRRDVSRLQGRSVILIDDIITTGATLAAAETVLRAAGLQVLGAAALCVVVTQREKHATQANNSQNGHAGE